MRSLYLCLLTAIGCSQTLNPCPAGERLNRSQDRCVAVLEPDAGDDDEPLSDAEPGLTTADDSSASDSGDDALDSGSTGDDALDSGSTGDDALDSGSFVADAGQDGETTGDAEPDGTTAALDAAQDAEADTQPPVCSQADVQAWSAGHLAEGLVALITACYGSCKEDALCADTCVHDQIGLQGCSACTSAQSACTSSLCGAACTVSKSDKMCLACLCEADCVGIFERCASAEIAVCSPALFGRDATAAEHTLDTPILLRQKTQTGGLRAVRLEVSGTQTWPTSSTFQFSTGFETLLSFPIAGLEYVLHAKSTCAAEPCIARISPILSDGSFGRPVYDQSWTRGFDHVDMFMVGATPYLLRYKSGRVASVDDPAGTVWVDRIDSNAEQTALTLTSVARTVWLGSGQEAFAEIEPFQLAGSTFLLLRAQATGEVRVLRVQQPDPLALTFTALTSTVSWPDVDIVETVRVGSDWFVFTYDNAAGDVKQGTARLFGFVSEGDGQLSLTAPLYESSWAERVSHAIGHAAGGASFLITHDAATGRANQRALASDTTSWPDTFGTVLRTQAVGFNPPWNVVEIAGQGKW